MPEQHGYTLILIEPGLTPTEFHLSPAPGEVRSEKNALTTLIPLPNLSVYREGHGNGIEEITLAGTFGARPRQVGPISWTGAEMFLAFRRGFWDKYQSLFGSSDPKKNKVKIEYHNWDEDEHYYAEPTKFITPRGADNRTFFRYEFSLQLYAPIVRKFNIAVVDKLSLADRAAKWLKVVAEKIQAAGKWLSEKTGQAASWLTRNVLQPITLLSNALMTFVAGAASVVNFPIRAVVTLGNAIAATIESLGSIVGTALTEMANTLHNTRRMLNRLHQAPAIFKQSVEDGVEDLGRQYYQLVDQSDSPTVQAEKQSGRNLLSRQYAASVGGDSYSGAKKVRVRAGDTLQKIAMREMGTGERWHEIALLNNLSRTDISSLVGKDVLVPSIPSLEGSGVIGDLGDDRMIHQADLAERLYGRDLALDDNRGKLSVVFGAQNDLVTVGGVANLRQAITLKTRIFQRQLLENPEFGLARLVGRKGTSTETLALKHGLLVTAKSDPRIENAEVSVSSAGNATTANFLLAPVGVAGSRPITAVIGGV